ncbi:hypothetical protein QQP08_021778 [Theobroma cacao]|nr:hypothetical protein QQP08_021778 [Theobroma cacao]
MALLLGSSLSMPKTWLQTPHFRTYQKKTLVIECVKPPRPKTRSGKPPQINRGRSKAMDRSMMEGINNSLHSSSNNMNEGKKTNGEIDDHDGTAEKHEAAD